MIGRIWTAYCVELMKAARQRFTYGGPAIMVAAVLVSLLVHPIHRDAHSDYNFVAYATTSALGLAGLVILVLFTATQMCNEFARGTVRLVLVRPILRHEFLLAKLLLCMTYSLVLTLATAVAAWLVAIVSGDVLGVSYGGDMGYAGTEMAMTYLYGMCLALLPQWAAVAYTLFFATLIRNTASAIGATIGLWIVVDTAKYPLGFAPFVFSTYLDSPWQPFSDMTSGFPPHWMPMAWQCATASLGATVFFVLGAAIVMHCRNLQA